MTLYLCWLFFAFCGVVGLVLSTLVVGVALNLILNWFISTFPGEGR